MRKHLYLVTEHEDPYRVGGCRIFDQRMSRPLKNEEGPITALNEDKDGFEHIGKMVGMGYADFDDEEDYENRIVDVMQSKLSQLDDEWLEKAGVLEAAEA